MTRSFPTPGLERLTLGLTAVLLAVTAHADPAGRTLMRYPTLSGDAIVFVAHDNLWSVPRTGGTASRLTRPRRSPKNIHRARRAVVLERRHQSAAERQLFAVLAPKLGSQHP